MERNPRQRLRPTSKFINRKHDSVLTNVIWNVTHRDRDSPTTGENVTMKNRISKTVRELGQGRMIEHRRVYCIVFRKSNFMQHILVCLGGEHHHRSHRQIRLSYTLAGQRFRDEIENTRRSQRQNRSVRRVCRTIFMGHNTITGLIQIHQCVVRPRESSLFKYILKHEIHKGMKPCWYVIPGYQTLFGHSPSEWCTPPTAKNDEPIANFEQHL